MHRLTPLMLVLAVALLVAGCGRDDGSSPSGRSGLAPGGSAQTAEELGFPTFATKNTTRVATSDPTSAAAAVALAVNPGDRKPEAVALVGRADWRTAIAASALMADPIGAPLLFTDGDDLPGASENALSKLDPSGSAEAGDAQVIRVGTTAPVGGRKTTDLTGANPFARARAIAGLLSAARGQTPARVMIVSADEPDFAAPAAAYAAKSGDPVLFVGRDVLPPETRAALAALQRPRIYVLGPSRLISPRVTRQLRRLGRVRRVGGRTTISNAIAFARYRDSAFGWGIVDPGHGLVFARAGRPLEAAAVAPLSGSGTYGPLLLLDGPAEPPRALQQYLLDIQPGYEKDPVRGVYNHGWVIGDADAISVAAQSRLDALLEIVPVQTPDEVPPPPSSRSSRPRSNRPRTTTTPRPSTTPRRSPSPRRSTTTPRRSTTTPRRSTTTPRRRTTTAPQPPT